MSDSGGAGHGGHHCHGGHGSGFIHHPDQSASWSMSVQGERNSYARMGANPVVIIALALFVGGVLISLPYVLDAIQLSDLQKAGTTKATSGASETAAPSNSSEAVSGSTEASDTAEKSTGAARDQNEIARFGHPRAELNQASDYQDYSRSSQETAQAYAANPLGFGMSGPMAGQTAQFNGQPSQSSQNRMINGSYMLQESSSDGKKLSKLRLMVTR